MGKNSRKDNDPSIKPLRILASYIAKILFKTGITANQVTIFSFIIFVPIVIYLIIQGKYLYNLIALGLIFITIIFDLSDGVLARLRSEQSKFGAWLDGSLDTIFQSFLLIAVIICTVKQTGNPQWFIIGMIMLFGQTMAHFVGFNYSRDFGFDSYSGSEIFNCKFNNLKRIPLFDSYLKNIIVPSNLAYISIFTVRYLLTLGILIDRLDIFILVFSITINIRWLSMFLLYLKFLAIDSESKLYTIKFLKEIHEESNIMYSKRNQ